MNVKHYPFHRHITSTVWNEFKDRFEYRPKAKWPWLQRQIFKILDRLGAHASIPTQKIERLTIIPDDLFKSIWGQANEIERHHIELSDCTVLVGSSDFERIMCLPRDQVYMLSRPIKIDCQGELYDGMTRDTFYRGLRVQVVPWMQGVVVIPQEFLK